MELLSIEYGDLAELSDSERAEPELSACLRMTLFVDPALVCDDRSCSLVIADLARTFPAVSRAQVSEEGIEAQLRGIAELTAGLILDLQRDLCEWPSGAWYTVRDAEGEYMYLLLVESIDERVGRFAAELAVSVVRMIMLGEPFDPRITWLIDLVRHLRRHPRIRLNPKRVARLIGCSRSSAEWAIQGLERYGYVHAADARRRRRSKGGRILVVDDSAQVRDVLSRILETLGYDVITATDGEEGLILLDWANYQAIFVDMVMPCLDGTTFLEQARAQGVTCPIIIISAYGSRWDVETLCQRGATAYIEKPFSTREIESLIARHLC